MEDKEFISLCRQKDDKGFDLIKEFIDNKGSFKKMKDVKGASSLHIAVRSNNLKIIKLLLDNGLSPMIKDETKQTKNPIIVGIETGNIDAVLLLLGDKKIKAPRTKNRYSEFSALGLNTTLSNNEFETILKTLVKNGFNINLPDSDKKTVLLKSIEQQNLSRVKICLKYADVNETTRIPLRFAISRHEENNDIIKSIIGAGANLVIKSKTEWGDGFNALEEAHMFSNIEIFGYLINEFNALDTLEEDTLEDIISHKEIEYLKFLWEIPKVHDYIIKHNLEEAFPKEIQDIFIF